MEIHVHGRRYYITVLLIVMAGFLTHGTLTAQLSGNYTLGAGGDYENFSEAVNALNAQGISGTVVFHVRAGIYEPVVATDPVIKMDQNIPGSSASNRIIFRPDSSSGANRDNVILTRRSPPPGSPRRSLPGYGATMSHSKASRSRMRTP